MPAVDQGSGLIFWLKAGTGEMELYLVNLWEGWRAFELSLQARQLAQGPGRYPPQRRQRGHHPAARPGRPAGAFGGCSRGQQGTGGDGRWRDPRCFTRSGPVRPARPASTPSAVPRSPGRPRRRLATAPCPPSNPHRRTPRHQLAAIAALLDDVEGRLPAQSIHTRTHSLFDDEEPF